jgi:glutathione S-transferase
MSSLKLFSAPGSCSLAVHIALIAGGFNYQIAKVSMTNKGMMVGDEPLAKVNPKGRVPALQIDGGKILTEGPVINQYLQSQAPDKLYFPEGDAKWDALSTLNFLTSDLHKGVSMYFAPYISDEAKEQHKIYNSKRNFGYLNSLLEGKDYLFGDKVSIADYYAYVISTWTVMLKVDISEFKNVIEFGKRMESQPPVQQALKEAGLNPSFS